MQTVKVSRLELLKKVNDNRAQHKKDYDDAMQKYSKEAVEALEQLLQDARSGNIKHSIDTVRPREYLKEYDRAITMLEMSKDEILEISLQDFDQLVMDNWSWQQTFSSVTKVYNSK